MTYRIKENLLEVMKKLDYEFIGLEQFLINQEIEEDSTLSETINYWDKLDLDIFLVGVVDSKLITGKFIIPKECLEIFPGLPYGSKLI